MKNKNKNNFNKQSFMDKLEKLKEVNKKIEEFQTVKVVPVAPEPEPMYTLTKEQEEERCSGRGLQLISTPSRHFSRLKISGFSAYQSPVQQCIPFCYRHFRILGSMTRF